MKRALLWSLLLLVFLCVGVVGTVLLRADPTALPAPDPALLIHLPDGSARPLAQVLELAREGQPLLPPPATAAALDGLPAAPAGAPLDPAAHERLQDQQRARIVLEIGSQEGTVFHLAEIARHAGRLDEAAALYLSVPEDDPRYGRAQRRLAWDVMTKGQGQPQRAVSYAHAALAAEPLDGNSWQDLARVYGATLGLDVEEWD